MEDIIIDVDLAKRIFQLHGATGSGALNFRKRLTRDQFRDFMSRHSPSSVVFEVCGGSSYWAREMHMLGHEVPLIAPQYVMNRPGFTGGQNSRSIAGYGTDIKEEDLEAVFT